MVIDISAPSGAATRIQRDLEEAEQRIRQAASTVRAELAQARQGKWELEEALKGERAGRAALKARLESAEAALLEEKARTQEISRTLERYKQDRAKLLANDSAMRAMISEFNGKYRALQQETLRKQEDSQRRFASLNEEVRQLKELLLHNENVKEALWQELVEAQRQAPEPRTARGRVPLPVGRAMDKLNDAQALRQVERAAQRREEECIRIGDAPPEPTGPSKRREKRQEIDFEPV